jgi:hypothetical protein
MVNQTNKNGGQVQYEKPAIIYTGLFENPMGSPIDPGGGFDGEEFRIERHDGQNWLRSFVDLLRVG